MNDQPPPNSETQQPEQPGTDQQESTQASPEDEPRFDEAIRTGQATDQVAAARPTALGDDAADSLCFETRTTILVLAGDVNSGKTSIFASLYERFGRGPLAGRLFAGSRTLLGFEERCHGWREESGNVAPEIAHTQPGAPPWLHLRMQDVEQRNPVQDLLMADIPGETFTRLRDGRTPGTDLPFLWRADHVCVLLDGENMAVNQKRHAELERGRNLFRELLKPNVLAENRALSLLLTKLDLVIRQPITQQKAVEDEIAELRSWVSRALGYNGVMPMLRTAARSETDVYPIGHGLEELLDLVTDRPARHVSTRFRSQEVSFNPLLEFRS